MTLDRSGAALRASLQETVLHVALLAQRASIPEIHVWRARCIGLVERLDQAMRDGGCAADIVRDVGIAQCELLDDVTLRHLPAGKQDEWLRETLLFRFHRLRSDAGGITARFDAWSSVADSDVQLVDVYRTLLDLRPSPDGDDVRDVPNARCAATSHGEQRVAQSASEPARSFARRFAAAAARAWTPLWQAMVAMAVLAAVWIACDISLRRAVERLPESAARVALDSEEARR
ncbi:DotU family type IV/VI secretion system protein [Burkholderia dolosa]|uniref:DotU family type IV/VI secretion system protein n=1 Tax=Burkholderia dolosa TaxID=152500 RepID=UPI001B993C27|nr:DotU family type IV/VI secretion system protein [Burkholderia dolosa]MBR8056196.1 DotU family type IV/VI secretion system protein [Burkholderia dolosa]